MNQQTPAHPRIERQVLRDALEDRDVAVAYADEYALRGEHFLDPALRTIWAVLRHHLEHGEGPLDAVVLDATLTARSNLIEAATDPDTVRSRLGEVLDLPPTGGNAEHANLLTDAASRRRIIAAGQVLIREAHALDQAPAAVVARGHDRLVEADLRPAGGEGQDMQTTLRDGAEEWQDIIEPRYLPTGIAGLDKLIGGVERGRLITGAGRPGMGKSVFGLALSRRVITASDRHVLHFSLEMPRIELAARYAASTGAAAFAALTGKDRAAHARIDWVRLFDLADDSAGARLRVLEKTDARSIDDIERIARRYHRHTGDVGLVVVDYIGLLRPADNRITNRVQQVGDITARLKELAGELDAPVLALAQLNREVEKRLVKVPVLSDLRESGDVEQDSDQVIFVHRPEVYDPMDRPGDADLIVAKNRAGDTGTATVVFDGPHVRFVPKRGPVAATWDQYRAAVPLPGDAR